jgi:hypothetical protein
VPSVGVATGQPSGRSGVAVVCGGGIGGGIGVVAFGGGGVIVAEPVERPHDAAPAPADATSGSPRVRARAKRTYRGSESISATVARVPAARGRERAHRASPGTRGRCHERAAACRVSLHARGALN